MPAQKRTAVFLDRDGVLNASRIIDGKPYAARTLSELELIPDVAQACTRLREAGLLLIAVTNQPEVSRGTMPLAEVEAMNGALRQKLGLDDFQLCPHDDRDRCGCRKPKPGMLHTAAAKLGVDLGASIMVGDRWRDIEAGRAAGCATVFVDYGYDEKRPVADHVSKSLAEAVPWIIQQTTGR